jgi:hypothetical protein
VRHARLIFPGPTLPSGTAERPGVLEIGANKVAAFHELAE